MLKNKLRWFSTVLALSVVISACTGAPTPAKVAGPETVTGLAFNPADKSLLKTDAAGLFRLATDGQTWEAINTPATSGLTGIVINPDAPAILYASGPGVGVLKSTNGGLDWSQINNGLPDTEITALAIHSFRRETLYVWVKGEGIYRTEDGGTNWKRIPDQGPPDKDVHGLTHSTLPGSMNTGWLYASTANDAYLSMDCF